MLSINQTFTYGFLFFCHVPRKIIQNFNMKNILFSLSFLFIVHLTFGQNTPIIEKENTVEKTPHQKERKVYHIVHQKPEYPGGEKGLFLFLTKNLRYPADAKEKGIEGNVVVKFVVNENGKLSDLEVLRGIGGGCDEETLRVIYAMPNWIPGRHNGANVNVYYTLPVRFKL
jgi:periplasmic protein TonB